MLVHISHSQSCEMTEYDYFFCLGKAKLGKHRTAPCEMCCSWPCRRHNKCAGYMCLIVAHLVEQRLPLN